MSDIAGDSRGLTLETWDTFLSGGPVEHAVRPSILASWRRCRSLGLAPHARELTYRDDFEVSERLLDAAAPVFGYIESVVSGSKAMAILTDSHATVLRCVVGEPSLRRALEHLSMAPGFSYAEESAGTNACGTTLVERLPCCVIGAEHFTERMRGYSCAAAPIRDAVSGRIEGTVAITCPYADATPDMAAMVRGLSHDIENRLLADYTRREQALLDAYGWGDPVLGSGVMPDGVQADDLPRLRAHATRLISHAGQAGVRVSLSHDHAVTLRCRPLTSPSGVSGVAVEADLAWAGRETTVGDDPAGTPAEADRERPAAGPALDSSPARRWLLLVGEPGVGRLAVAASERLRVLYEASVRIGTTLDVRRTAEELAEVAVPGLADAAAVDLARPVLGGEEPSGPDTELCRVAVAPVAGSRLSVPPGAPVPLTPASAQSRAYLGTGAVLEHRSTPVEGAHSVMCVPLLARDTVLGVATFHRSLRSEPFEDDDLSLAEEFVARAAVCIDNARRYANEHATALALQRSLLPHKLPANSAVEVAHAYLPAQGAIGGDWFDVIPLSGARVALVVGDVIGHGLHATATMGRLRTAVHNFAALDLSPDELLAHLDDLVNRLDQDVSEDGIGDGVIGATCLYAVYDPVSRRCTLASAGHPPPAIVRSGSAVDFLGVPTGPPLGLGGFPFETVDVPLPEGSQLVLYTDGLFERRHRDPDLGLEALRRMLSGAHRPPGATCDAALAALPADGPQDDVAVLVAQTHALGPDQVTEWEVPPDPAAVAGLRAAAARRLATWGLEELSHTTELVLSELVTNALRHAFGPVRLRLVRDQALICEVSDGSSTYPRLRRSGGSDEDGRGVFLVAQLTQRRGTRHTGHGKVIWAEQALPTGK